MRPSRTDHSRRAKPPPAGRRACAAPPPGRAGCRAGRSRRAARPPGPSGGSMKPARPIKTSGQWRASLTRPGGVQQGRQPDQQDHDAGPVVVVLGTRRCRWALRGGSRPSPGVKACGRWAAWRACHSVSSWACRAGRARSAWPGLVEPGPGRGEAIGDLGPGDPVVRQVGGRRDRGEGGGGARGRRCRDHFRLDEAAEPRRPAGGGPRRCSSQVIRRRRGPAASPGTRLGRRP